MNHEMYCEPLFPPEFSDEQKLAAMQELWRVVSTLPQEFPLGKQIAAALCTCSEVDAGGSVGFDVAGCRIHCPDNGLG